MDLRAEIEADARRMDDDDALGDSPFVLNAFDLPPALRPIVTDAQGRFVFPPLRARMEKLRAEAREAGRSADELQTLRAQMRETVDAFVRLRALTKAYDADNDATHTALYEAMKPWADVLVALAAEHASHSTRQLFTTPAAAPLPPPLRPLPTTADDLVLPSPARLPNVPRATFNPVNVRDLLLTRVPESVLQTAHSTPTLSPRALPLLQSPPPSRSPTPSPPAALLRSPSPLMQRLLSPASRRPTSPLLSMTSPAGMGITSRPASPKPHLIVRLPSPAAAPLRDDNTPLHRLLKSIPGITGIAAGALPSPRPRTPPPPPPLTVATFREPLPRRTNDVNLNDNADSASSSSASSPSIAADRDEEEDEKEETNDQGDAASCPLAAATATNSTAPMVTTCPLAAAAEAQETKEETVAQLRSQPPSPPPESARALDPAVDALVNRMKARGEAPQDLIVDIAPDERGERVTFVVSLPHAAVQVSETLRLQLANTIQALAAALHHAVVEAECWLQIGPTSHNAFAFMRETLARALLRDQLPASARDSIAVRVASLKPRRALVSGTTRAGIESATLQETVNKALAALGLTCEFRAVPLF